MRENRRFEASGGQRCRGLFPERYGRESDEERLGFSSD